MSVVYSYVGEISDAMLDDSFAAGTAFTNFLLKMRNFSSLKKTKDIY
jgi:hypothetical protein